MFDNDNKNQNQPKPASGPLPSITGVSALPGGGAMPSPAPASAPLMAASLAPMPDSPVPTLPKPIFSSGGVMEPPAGEKVIQPPGPTMNSEPPSMPADGDLVEIKKQVLQDLTPLVDKLDQSPEEHFKTTMMLIQASDNAGLVKKAYEAANSIQDEKVRAQALLDVVNEINYFTQAQQPPKDQS